MKFVSWNVNGLRACMNKGFLDSFYALDADFFCLQETKLQAGQIELDLPGYEQYWCYAEKKGYSGTAIFTKHHPLSVSYGLGIAELDTEGRLITLEYPEFYLVTCYTPNAQRGLARIEHRLKWEDAFRAYLTELDSKKPVILCGDLNVAHQEIDLKNPSSNRGNAGFSDEERGAFSQLLGCGFTDSFRYLYPDKTGAYSWWSYMFNARANNAGWRIDYFVVSDRLKETIYDATIHPDVMGSDHCPVGLDLNITCNGGIWSPETQRPEQKDAKKADGDSPAGLILKLGITAVCILALLIPAYFFFRKEPTVLQTPPPTTEPFSITGDLIKEVIDRTETASLSYMVSNPVSSYIQETITDGSSTWTLTGKYVIASSFPPVKDNEQSMIPFPTTNNFFIQIDFTELPRGVIPTIKVKPSQVYEYTIALAYYYDSNGAVDGCFLYGLAGSPMYLLITAKYNDTEQIYLTDAIVPIGIFDGVTTSQLITYIHKSDIMMRPSTSAVWITLEELVDTDPYIQELLKRDDAITIMLNILEQDKGHFTLFGVDNLLTTKQFQSRMTDAERERMDEIIANRSDEIIYG